MMMIMTKKVEQEGEEEEGCKMKENKAKEKEKYKGWKRWKIGKVNRRKVR